MKLDPIPALIATDERVEKAIREAPNWSSYADKISYMEKELEAAKDVVFFSRLLIDSVIRYEDGDVTISSSYSASLQDALMRYDETRRG